MSRRDLLRALGLVALVAAAGAGCGRYGPPQRQRPAPERERTDEEKR